MRLPGELRHAQRLGEMGERPVDAAGDPVVVRVGGHRRLDELGLPAVAVWRDHQPTGDRVGDRRAMVAPDHVDAQVQPGGAAGAGEQVAVVEIEHVRVHLDPWVTPRQQLGVLPVGGGPPAVEEPGAGQRERARADRHDAGTASVRPAQRGHQLG
ncbi:hypothetical protein HNR22_005061 [Micromonospora jinlongensis]|uniref:Uncharacterized protein n=1 Tax=Micromonospora jinlongensis TaxID=1287877 RepID=A0A7Y9X531_9ACTN|nr:hypothetical protein [Micromonospora jinlongensis]